MSFARNGQRVLIIGGSYGMGLATAVLAVERGAEVAIAARGAERLAAAVEQLEASSGRKVPSRTLMIEDRQAVRRFMKENAPFDHLVMPGSTVKPLLYDQLDETEVEAAFASKLWGPFWAAFDSRASIRRGGSIVFFTGVAATRPVKGYIMGGMINGALNAATRSLALEFAELGVRVNTIAPGLTDTPLMDILHAHDKEQLLGRMAARLPVKRIGQAEDMAKAAVYLMANPFVTAQVLGVDGGQVVMD